MEKQNSFNKVSYILNISVITLKLLKSVYQTIHLLFFNPAAYNYFKISYCIFQQLNYISKLTDDFRQKFFQENVKTKIFLIVYMNVM